MQTSNLLVLGGNEVSHILDGQEKELIQMVREAYIAHAQGASSLPHSTFLHFPEDTRSRIIALPAYLGAPFEVAGVKWISSFPENIEHGFPRASGVIILNSTQTGMPQAILEGSIINAKRTAASATLAALYLQRERVIPVPGIIGCGFINFEIVRFMRVMYPHVEGFMLFDSDDARATRFQERCRELDSNLQIAIVRSPNDIFRNCNLISFATTAGTPHIFDLSACLPRSVLLHISLRDIAPTVLLDCNNIVDDIDHVTRAQTSLHLAQQLVGNTEYIRGTLADVLLERVPVWKQTDAPTVFSPFGLGILDIAVGKFVYETAVREHKGISIPAFLPPLEQ